MQICLVDSVLLNALEEYILNKLWEKLGNLYWKKYMVKKLFLRKKLYLLRMGEGDFVTENMNAFNIMIILFDVHGY